MKKNLLIWLPLCIMSSMILFTACIKDEALNNEADITACSVAGDLLIREPEIGNQEVVLYVNKWTDISAIAPFFTLTPGATITPANGTVLDFTKPQTYTVTSQSGNWKKQYTVKFVCEGILTQYHFENVKPFVNTDLDGNTTELPDIQVFYEKNEQTGRTMDWASGNYGYYIANAISFGGKAEYPTTQSDDGYIGKCAKLTTCDTGPAGAMFGAALAAGNLFIGTFDMTQPTMSEKTRFGTPFRNEPVELSGYYKYQPGEHYISKNTQVVPNRVDSFDIYAVFFDATQTSYLNGDNVLTDSSIVSIARIPKELRKATDKWTYFSVPFTKINGKPIDSDKLASGQYSISIVCSSSMDGAHMCGAVGSTLYVDEIELHCKND